jgi:hypothetical protein
MSTFSVSKITDSSSLPRLPTSSVLKVTSGSQSIPTITPTLADLSAIEFTNNGFNVDFDNDSVSVTNSGNYQVSVRQTWSSAFGGTRTLELLVDSVAVNESTRVATSGNQDLSINTMLALSPQQSVQVRLTHTVSSSPATSIFAELNLNRL